MPKLFRWVVASGEGTRAYGVSGSDSFENRDGH